jgi:acyl-coenzyme A thioesterase PaaI-like protein
MSDPVSTAIQDHYPDDVAHCYGCGGLNPDGHQLKSRWDGDETVARYTPRARHTAIPGYVYGGLIASLIDCHGTGTGALVAARAEGWDPGPKMPRGAKARRYVTASLRVDYLKPTPLGPELEIRGRVTETSAKKVVMEATVTAAGEVTARGTVVAVRMPEQMVASS